MKKNQACDPKSWGFLRHGPLENHFITVLKNELASLAWYVFAATGEGA